MSRGVPLHHAFAWSAPALKKLRVEAEISLEAMAGALGFSVAGLRVIEGRRHVTVGVVEKYRKALNAVVTKIGAA